MSTHGLPVAAAALLLNSARRTYFPFLPSQTRSPRPTPCRCQSKPPFWFCFCLTLWWTPGFPPENISLSTLRFSLLIMRRIARKEAECQKILPETKVTQKHHRDEIWWEKRAERNPKVNSVKGWTLKVSNKDKIQGWDGNAAGNNGVGSDLCAGATLRWLCSTFYLRCFSF